MEKIKSAYFSEASQRRQAVRKTMKAITITEEPFTMNFLSTPLIRKIMVETGEEKAIAENIGRKLNNIKNSELYSVAIAWARGVEKPFTLKSVGTSITLEDIMKKENKSRIEAILSMNIFVENPKLATQYKKFKFYVM